LAGGVRYSLVALRKTAPSTISGSQNSIWAVTLYGPVPSASHVGMLAIETGRSANRPSTMEYSISTCSERSIREISQRSGAPSLRISGL
jgi:hypothetical protein